MSLAETERVDSPSNFALDAVQLMFSGHKVCLNYGPYGNVKAAATMEQSF